MNQIDVSALLHYYYNFIFTFYRVLLISNIKQVMKIAVHLDDFLAFKRGYCRDFKMEKEFSPLFILARIQGSINLYKDLCKSFDSGLFLKKNPFNFISYSPDNNFIFQTEQQLWLATQKGDIFQYFFS